MEWDRKEGRKGREKRDKPINSSLPSVVSVLQVRGGNFGRMGVVSREDVVSDRMGVDEVVDSASGVADNEGSVGARLIV